MRKVDAEQLFQICYGEYADALFRFCVMKTSNREVALDLSQETFVRFWGELRAKRHIEKPRAFLYTIARNLVIDHYRRKKTGSLDALEEHSGEFGEAPRSEEASAYREALGAIGTLPPEYRDAVFLRYVEEMKPREIAEITGEPVNVISIRITRGMKELRSRLGIDS